MGCKFQLRSLFSVFDASLLGLLNTYRQRNEAIKKHIYNLIQILVEVEKNVDTLCLCVALKSQVLSLQLQFTFVLSPTLTYKPSANVGTEQKCKGACLQLFLRWIIRVLNRQPVRHWTSLSTSWATVAAATVFTTTCGLSYCTKQNCGLMQCSFLGLAGLLLKPGEERDDWFSMLCKRRLAFDFTVVKIK